MDLTTITVAQFQAQFFRDFPYLPTWNSATTYVAGNVVYYNGLFYNSLVNSNLNVTPGSDTTKWQQTNEPNALDYVQPQDITNAFAEAQVLFNQDIFDAGPNNSTIILAYLYLTAHYLVNDLRAAMAGINGTGAGFPVQSRTVGSMSESYAIPDSYKNNPQLAFFTTTSYGMKYLSMLIPNLVGNVVGVNGGTNP